MTREEEAIEELKILKEDYWEDDGYGYATAECQKAISALDMAIEALEQQTCEDCISRQAVLDINENHHGQMPKHVNHEIWNEIKALPSVTPKEKTRKGEWLRMSDLSEHEDDRYKCSHCGNVVHYKDKMNLYTFNSWCGRCGSDNRRKGKVL